jgi:hypothetical protein
MQSREHRRPGFRAAALLLAWLLLLGVAGPAQAQADWDDIQPWDGQQSRPLLERSLQEEQAATTIQKIGGKAGGYSVLTPVILALTRGAELSARRAEGQPVGKDEWALDFLGTRQFWGGFAGDVIATTLTMGVAAALPGPAFVKALLPVAAGFIGWEIGSGNLKNTDWASLSVQIGAVAAVQMALTAALVAVPGAGLIAAVGGAAAGIAAGMLFEKLRAQPTSDFRPQAQEAKPARTAGESPRSWGSRPPESDRGSTASGQTDRRRGYAALLDSMRNNDRQGTADAYRDYQGDTLAPQPAANR